MLLVMPDLQIVMLALLLLCFFVYICAMYLLAECTMYVTLLAQTQAPSLWASELPQTYNICFGCTYIHMTCPMFTWMPSLLSLKLKALWDSYSLRTY